MDPEIEGSLTRSPQCADWGSQINTCALRSDDTDARKAEIFPPPIESAAERTLSEIDHRRRQFYDMNQLFINLKGRGGVLTLVRQWPKVERKRFAKLLQVRAQEFATLADTILEMGNEDNEA
jgi:hypothetical protein